MVTEESRDKIDKICKKKGEGMRAVQSDDAASDYKNGKMLDRSIIWVDGRLKKITTATWARLARLRVRRRLFRT